MGVGVGLGLGLVVGAVAGVNVGVSGVSGRGHVCVPRGEEHMCEQLHM